SCALRPRVDRLIGLDINLLDVEEGRSRVKDEGLDNVELVHCPVDEILERTRTLAGDVDVFLFYAVLEHMTIEERLDALAVAQEVVGREGHIIVCELPNRLIPFDGHTSLM